MRSENRRSTGEALKLWCITLLLGAVALSGCTKKEETVAAPSFRGTVQGFVRDHATNAPLSGVTVTLFVGGERTATTDSYGYWFFNDVIAEDNVGTANGCPNGCIAYYLKPPAPATPGAPNYLSMMGTVSLDQMTAATSLVTVADFMVKTATVSGMVTDAATGAGINGATVVLNTSDQFLKVTPTGSNAAVLLAAQYTATTANHATSGAAGAYSLQVPALLLNLAAGQIGAYANGYEYSIVNDASSLNLQFASAAAVDFKLTPLNTALGLVAANASVTSGTTAAMQILRDAAGTAPTNPLAPDIDFNGATQLVFNLTFDQPVNASQFFSDSIVLKDSGGSLVFPSMTATWSNAYSVTLTASANLQKFVVGTTYRLVSNRTVQSSTANAAIGTGTNLAQFHAINSGLNATVPTPALFLSPALYDSAIQAENGVLRYLANDPVFLTANTQVTTSSGYTGISERFAKGKYSFDVNPYVSAVDIQAPRTQANLDSSAMTLYFRIVNPASGETVRNWAPVNAVLGGATTNKDYVVFNNVQPMAGGGPLPYNIAGLTSNNLRYGNRLDFAVTVKNTSGIETPIDEAKILSLRDQRAPELAAASLASRVWFTNATAAGAALVFSEQMNTSTAATITNVTNAGLFTTTPVWDVNGNTLYVNASSSATATVYQVGAAAGLNTVAANVITFASAGAANGFFVGQTLNLTYQDNSVQQRTVTAISSGGANPTLTLSANPAALRFSTTVPFTVSVSKLATQLRAPTAVTGLALGSAATTYTTVGQPYAVGDRILLRQTTGTVQAGEADVVVTVVDYNSGTGVVTFSPAVPNTGATYDTAIFEGDVLQVSAADENGNAVHADANEIVVDVTNVFGAGANAKRIR